MADSEVSAQRVARLKQAAARIDPPRWPDHVVVEVMASVDASGAPYTAHARWKGDRRPLAEVEGGTTPEMAVEAVLAAVRLRLGNLQVDGDDR